MTKITTVVMKLPHLVTLTGTNYLTVRAISDPLEHLVTSTSIFLCIATLKTFFERRIFSWLG